MTKNLFAHITLSEFDRLFPDDEHCLEFLANEKWKGGYVCRKCGHTNYCRGKTPFSRRCTACKHEESATSHTFFHHCKMPLREAFHIAFMVCHTPDISTYELSRVHDKRQMTCWKFKKKIQECIDKKGELTTIG